MVVAQTTRPFKRIGFVTSFKATVRTDTVDGGGKREKEGKETSVREQPGQTGAGEERGAAEKCQLREVFSRAEEECWRWKKRNRREKKVEKAGLDPAAAAPSQPA